MSKLFEVLGRLEEQSAGSSVQVQPVNRRPVADIPLPALPAEDPESFSKEPFSNPSRAEAPGPQAAQPARLAFRVAFDAGMVLIALALFVGVCIMAGSMSAFALTKSLPLLASVLAGLALLYWFLSAILNLGTPGKRLAEERASRAQGRMLNAGQRDLRKMLDQPFAPPNRRQAAGFLRRALAEDLALARRILINEGVLDAYGSVSVRDDRDPNRIFLAGADICEYDLNGKPVGGGPSNGDWEHFIHCEIYRARPDVMAIVHSRASELLPFAASSLPLLPISEMADFLIPGVPVFESRQVGQVRDPLIRARALGQALAETLGDKSAALMRGRGAVVVGPSLHVAVGRAYYMNLNARIQAQSIQLGGKVNYLESGEALAVTPASEFERAWEFWKEKVLM